MTRVLTEAEIRAEAARQYLGVGKAYLAALEAAAALEPTDGVTAEQHAGDPG